jgi:hypothetical protein
LKALVQKEETRRTGSRRKLSMSYGRPILCRAFFRCSIWLGASTLLLADAPDGRGQVRGREGSDPAPIP